jgi:sugar/nucleoside kinase (ribokinase family)
VLKVLSVGNTCLDLVLRYGRRLPAWGTEAFFDEAEWRLGGQGANFAIAAAKLELTTWLVSSLGADQIGKQFATELRSIQHVETKFLRMEGSSTGFSVAVVRADGERLFLTFLGHQRIYSLEKDVQDLFSVIDKDDFVHVSGYHMLPAFQAGLQPFLREIKSKGARVSFDPGWNPTGLNRSAKAELCRVLSHVDYFEPNEIELSAITDTRTIASGAKRLRAAYSGVLVVKRGRQGSTAIDVDDKHTNVRAFPVQVLDTTGAGDAFDAGFISGIARGQSLGASAKMGNATAALAISRIGAPNHRFPTRLEVASLLKSEGSRQFKLR